MTTDELDSIVQEQIDEGIHDETPRAPLTVEELRAAISGDCPREQAGVEHKGHYVEYTATETGDGGAWQDASCECGIAWREVSTVTFITEIDDSGDETGTGAQVEKGEERDRLRDALEACLDSQDCNGYIGVETAREARAALDKVPA